MIELAPAAYSLAERDRRWRAVRANAAQAGLDCVFVPLCLDGRNLHLSLEQAHGTRSDCRYLTQLENAAFILPTDGRPPIAIDDRGEGKDWLPEPRAANDGRRGSWAPAIAEALLELGMERARIGVTGLGRGKVTHGRAIAGVVNHSAYAEVQRRLPNATFVDGNDVVGFARYVKSQEEIDCLRRGAEIATAGIERMIEVARPGLPEAALYASVMERTLELGSEYYPLALYTGPLGGPLPRFENPPLERVLQPGSLIEHETDGVWGGIIAQEMQPIVLGPVPEAWKPAIELQREMFYLGLEKMKPGVLFAELIDFINGYGPSKGMRSIILMHGRGYGDDGPLLTPQDTRAEHFRDVPFQAGNTFVWKPIAYSDDWSIEFSWGGCIVITERGGEQLVKREPGLISIISPSPATAGEGVLRWPPQGTPRPAAAGVNVRAVPPPQRPRAGGGPHTPVWAGYSLAERDRRWQAVRANAAEAGLDCVWVPLGNCIDGRYLTQLRSSSIVLPTDGSLPIAIADRGSKNAWVPEPRLTSRDWAEPMAQALIDAGMERARIGVVGLLGGRFSHVRAADGVVVHSAFAHVRSKLPNARFENATDAVGRVRYVKSDEELACLRRAVEIAEAGVREMIAQAKPGVDAAVLYARVMRCMLEMGSEYYPLALRIGESARLTEPAAGLRLERGALITNEVSAVWGTQVAQEDQPILLGKLPDAWKPVIELQREAFELGLQLMKPGAELGQLIDAINGLGAKRGLRTSILMHGRGAGDDGPLLTPRATGDDVREVRIEKNTAWVWKPTASTADGRISFSWGGDAVVGESGAEALFKRQHGMVEA